MDELLKQVRGSILIIKCIEYIKEQTGVTLVPDDYFTGVKSRDDVKWFNAFLTDNRCSESSDFNKLFRFFGDYNGGLVFGLQQSGVGRVTLFVNEKADSAIKKHKGVRPPPVNHTSLLALHFMEKMLGEPSEGVVKAGQDELDVDYRNCFEIWNVEDGLKVMVQQVLKELEE